MNSESEKERGTVDEVWAQEGYGVLVDARGGRLRFDHWDVERRDFDRMVVGAAVEFLRAAAPGSEPRAVAVRLTE